MKSAFCKPIWNLISSVLIVGFTIYSLDTSGQSTFFSTYSYWEPAGWLEIADEPGRCVRETSDGNYLLLGLSDGKIIYTKIDQSGQHLWSKEIGYMDEMLYGERFIELDNGDILFAGTTYNAFDGHRTVLIRCDSVGDIIWSKIFPGSIGTIVFTLTELQNSNVLVAGQGSRFFIINDQGEVVSPFGLRRLGGFYNGFTNSITTSDGGVLLVGSAEFDSMQMTAAKLEENGDVEWYYHFGGDGFDVAGGCVETQDNGFLISGYTNSYGSTPSGLYDNILLKLNSEGEVMWCKAYGTQADEYTRGLAYTNDLGVVMVGWTGEAFSMDLQMMKVNLLGDLLWTRTYDYGEMDGASFVEKTSDNGFILTGGGINTFPWTGDHYVTKTDSSGLISNGCHDSPQYDTFDIEIPRFEDTYIQDTPFVNENLVVSVQDVCPEIEIVCGETYSFGLDDQEVCIGQTVELVIEESFPAEYTFQWYFEGEPIEGETSSSFAIENITETEEGTYTIQVVSGLCESIMMSSEVSIIDCTCLTPTFEISVTEAPACCGESVELYFLGIDSLFSSESSFLWSIGQSEVVSGAIFNDSIELVLNSCGEFNEISLTVTNPECVPSTEVIDIWVPSELEVSVEIGEDCGQCEGIADVNVNGGTPDYEVIFGDGLPLESNFVENLCGGEYWVQVVDSMGCSNTQEFTILNIDFPDVSVTSEVILCQESVVNITVDELPGMSYSWSNGEEGSVIEVSESDELVLTLIYETCEDEYLVHVNEVSLPEITIDNEGDLCNASFIILSAESEGDVYWLDNEESGGELLVYDEGVYTVIAQNEFGCESRENVEVLIDCDPEVFVPNAFTPNNDGVNEVFEVISSQTLEDFHLTVFNRWGQKVFDSFDQNVPWIGNFDNGEYYVQDGVYSWQLSYSSQRSSKPEIHHFLNGSVTLLR
ncbi:MAG: gliding motility-associated C-terminal domain-containing protein [Flavobacteriales bacterium]|nr:gliding motility-associated C-terminal domain-containing protein [Flavobacteriales bacterium]